MQKLWCRICLPVQNTLEKAEETSRSVLETNSNSFLSEWDKSLIFDNCWQYLPWGEAYFFRLWVIISAEMEWSFHSGWNEMESFHSCRNGVVIPFCPEWSVHSIPAGMERLHFIPARMEWAFHSGWKEMATQFQSWWNWVKISYQQDIFTFYLMPFNTYFTEMCNPFPPFLGTAKAYVPIRRFFGPPVHPSFSSNLQDLHPWYDFF